MQISDIHNKSEIISVKRRVWQTEYFSIWKENQAETKKLKTVWNFIKDMWIYKIGLFQVTCSMQ